MKMIQRDVIPDILNKRIPAVRFFVFDFDGVFTNNMVYLSEDGTESVRCFRGDGIGISKLKHLGVAMSILSSEPNPVVLQRAKKLGIECIHGCEEKGAALQSLARDKGFALQETAFMGNDVNDLPCLKLAGFSVVVQDAHADVTPYAHFQTENAGGDGAVREICDWFEAICQSSK